MANLFALSPLTVPEVFAKVNSSQFRRDEYNFSFMLYVIYQAWDAVLYHEMKQGRREMKIRRAAAWRASRCSFWRWNTMSNALYYFSNKMILPGEIKDAKMSSFTSDFQTHIKHSFPSYFFKSYWWFWEIQKRVLSWYKWRTSMKNCPYVQIKNFNQNNFLFDVGQRL